MTLKKFVVIPVIIGVLALCIQALDQLLSPSMPPEGNVGFSWICFQSWAVYFFAGCTLKGGVKTFISYCVGVAASIGIMELGGAMSAGLGFFAVPLAVGIVAFLAIFLERNEWTSLIPALFVGAGAFFAFMNYVPDATYGNAAFTIIVYCFIGLFFGYVTIALRSRYEAKVAKAKEE
ncbi:DUF1097 domain-containing protein [Parabacteroides sp. OttesenSCG-928-K15]|nr:DUF1097 domain-containing protein [Parabacteroides sp. OttesenSCG-928-K15]